MEANLLAKIYAKIKAVINDDTDSPDNAYSSEKMESDFVSKAGETMTGQLLFSGSARVTVDVWLGAASLRAPGSKPATFVELGLTGVWQFTDAVEANQESVSGTLKIPAEMDRTVVPTFKIGWSADGVSPGDCHWQLEYLWVAPNEATDAAAQEALTTTGTASSTSNGLIITSFSGIDLPATADQAMLYKITRLSADAKDTISDTVEMRGRVFTFTMNKLGTAT